MNFFRSSGFRVVLAATVTVTLLMGCQRIADIKKRMKRKAEKEAAQKAISEKSEEIWKDSMVQKTTEKEAEIVKSKLTLGDKTITFTEQSLILGLPKASADPGSGCEPSELQCASTNGALLSIKGIPLDTSEQSPGLAGQSWKITQESGSNTEIVAEDGTRWRLMEALIEFSKVEKGAVDFFLEGKAVDATGQDPEPVDVYGKLQAKVVDARAKN